MGCCSSQEGESEPLNTVKLPKQKAPSRFYTIRDKFKTIEDVQEGLRTAGLESSNLIIGIDYTKSNTFTGRNTFGGKSLHTLDPIIKNPYQEVIDIIGRTLEAFDDDKLIPAFGFGDSTTTDKSVFPFNSSRPCHGVAEVLQRYNELTPLVILAGPTSFAPLIRAAVEIVRQSRSYHILVIIADGAVNSIRETKAAIVEASSFPLSIIMIGVGDGPWDIMEEFDDELPQRIFDNFQFVNFNKVMQKAENREIDFAVGALQEIPEQFLLIRKLNLL